MANAHSIRYSIRVTAPWLGYEMVWGPWKGKDEAELRLKGGVRAAVGQANAGIGIGRSEDWFEVRIVPVLWSSTVDYVPPDPGGGDWIYSNYLKEEVLRYDRRRR